VHHRSAIISDYLQLLIADKNAGGTGGCAHHHAGGNHS
jgi:hypothetical protein